MIKYIFVLRKENSGHHGFKRPNYETWSSHERFFARLKFSCKIFPCPWRAVALTRTGNCVCVCVPENQQLATYTILKIVSFFFCVLASTATSAIGLPTVCGPTSSWTEKQVLTMLSLCCKQLLATSLDLRKAFDKAERGALFCGFKLTRYAGLFFSSF